MYKNTITITPHNVTFQRVPQEHFARFCRKLERAFRMAKMPKSRWSRSTTNYYFSRAIGLKRSGELVVALQSVFEGSGWKVDVRAEGMVEHSKRNSSKKTKYPKLMAAVSADPELGRELKRYVLDATAKKAGRK